MYLICFLLENFIWCPVAQKLSREAVVPGLAVGDLLIGHGQVIDSLSFGDKTFRSEQCDVLSSPFRTRCKGVHSKPASVRSVQAVKGQYIQTRCRSLSF